MTTPSWKPPLPERSAWETFESGVTIDFYIAEQMLTFAEAYRKAWVASLKPVAWTTMPEADDWDFISGELDPNAMLDGVWFPLYRLDDQP